MSDKQHAIIEVSDTLLRAFQAGTDIYAEPGIALLNPGSDPVLGQTAQENLRQQPTRIHSRYWSDLSTDPIQINNTSVRHTADLVWHQMADIKTKTGAEALSICVPSNISQAQMQLLTGICQSLELKVGSLINLGLAQILGHTAGDDSNVLKVGAPLLHLDLQLHQLIASKYRQTDMGLVYENHEVIQDISFLKLIDKLLYLLRDKFILSSRFDPLHSGDTEQQLFNQLIAMIYRGGNSVFQVNTAQKQYSIDLGIQELGNLIAEFSTQLSERFSEPGHSMVYSPVFSLLPGFPFSASDIALTPSDTSQGAQALLNQQNPDGSIRHIKHAELGLERPVASHPSPQDEQPEISANALLHNHIVYTSNSLNKLASTGFPSDRLNFNGGVMAIQGEELMINGHPATGEQKLRQGDVIETEDGTRLVAVNLAG